MSNPSDEDDDFLDGCELDFEEAAENEETASLRPLFPKGEDDAHLAEAYRELGGADAV